MDNIIRAVFQNSHFTKTCSRWKFDNGMVLQVDGVELPEWVEIHFSNVGDGTTTLGLMHNGEVNVPNLYFTTGKDINAYFYLHSDGDDGYTAYQVNIPVKSRPRPNDGEPTKTQEEALDAAIEALNEAAEHYPQIVDGYWYVWDATEGEYVNTNVKAEGEDGQDGFSPAVTVTEIEGGHQINITDAEHPSGQSFDVMDGAGGGGAGYIELTYTGDSFYLRTDEDGGGGDDAATIAAINAI